MKEPPTVGKEYEWQGPGGTWLVVTLVKTDVPGLEGRCWVRLRDDHFWVTCSELRDIVPPPQ